MTDHKVPFWVRMSDPSRTFYDPSTGLYLAQDQTQQVVALSRPILDAIHAGGLIVIVDDIPSEDTGIAPGSSTQEGTEAPTEAPEGTEDTSDTTGDTQDDSTDSDEDQDEEEDTTPPPPAEEEKQLSLADVMKLKKKK